MATKTTTITKELIKLPVAKIVASKDLLPNKEVAKDFTTFLHKTRELHKMCIGKELGEYEKVIDEFSESFFVLYDKHGVNMPLKTHVIIDHYKFYFEDTGNERHQW